MKLAKYLTLSTLFIGFSTVYATQMPTLSMQSPAFNIDVAILDGLYKTYDQYKNNFVNYLPTNIPIDRYKLVLRVEQERLKNELDSFSYRSVIFSWKNLGGGGNTIRWGSPYYPAESLVSQIIGKMYGSGENLSYSAYLTLYQLATKALTIGAVVGGVGLMQDIKAFQDKKKSLSEQIDKCNKMLELLEKA